MLSDKASVQAYIDDLYRRGYMVMINHPFWSRIEYDEILGLNNLFAVEIFNYCSQILVTWANPMSAMTPCSGTA